MKPPGRTEGLVNKTFMNALKCMTCQAVCSCANMLVAFQGSYPICTGQQGV